MTLSHLVARSSPTPTPTIFRYQDGVAPWESYIIIAFVALYGLMVLAGTGVLFKRRERRVIQARAPFVLIIPVTNNTWIAVAVATSYIVGRSATMCTVLSYAFLAYLPLTSLLYLFNIPTIVYADKLNSLKTTRVVGDNSWIWRIRYLFQDRSKLFFAFVALVIQVAVYAGLKYGGVAIPGGEEGFSAPGEGHDCYRLSLLVNAGFVILYMILLGWFTMKISKVQDPFFLTVELNLLSLIYTPLTIISVIYPIAPQIFPTSFDFRWVLLVNIGFGFFATIVIPLCLSIQKVEDYLVYKSHQFRKWLKNEESSMYTLDSLDPNSAIFALSEGVDVFKAVLDNAIMAAAFSDFCVSNWSVENFLFYKEVEGLRNNFPTMNQKERSTKAEVIIAEFVVTGAPLEINLEHHTRANLVKNVSENLQVTTFDPAQKHIYELMKKDSFEKFQKTSLYRKALESAMSTRSRSYDRTNSQSASHLPRQLSMNASHEGLVRPDLVFE